MGGRGDEVHEENGGLMFGEWGEAECPATTASCLKAARRGMGRPGMGRRAKAEHPATVSREHLSSNR